MIEFYRDILRALKIALTHYQSGNDYDPWNCAICHMMRKHAHLFSGSLCSMCPWIVLGPGRCTAYYLSINSEENFRQLRLEQLPEWIEGYKAALQACSQYDD